jgi:hypothetical protein
LDIRYGQSTCIGSSLLQRCIFLVSGMAITRGPTGSGGFPICNK